MKIRHRLYLLVMLYFLGLVAVLGLASYGMVKSARLRDTLSLGNELQVRSAEVKSLMKDIVFDLFAPKMYGQIRSLTYSPRSAVTIRQWQEAVVLYDSSFRRFMRQDYFSNTKDDLVQDQYLTALKMNERAMTMLSKTEETLFLLRENYQQTDNLYNTMQKNESLIPFFRDFRETSFFFTNSFESFINYFIETLREANQRLQRQIALLFTGFGIFILLLFSSITILMMRDIKEHFLTFENSFLRVARGDLSLQLDAGGKDEFAELALTFNHLIRDLKENMDSILNLTRDVGATIHESSDLNSLLGLVARAVNEDTSADAVIVLRRTADDLYTPVVESGEALDPEERSKLIDIVSRRIFRTRNQMILKDARLEAGFASIGSVVGVPLSVDTRIFAVVLSIKTGADSRFSDFGLRRLEMFAEFASLTIDNFQKYHELLEKREAQYQALAAQVQPHFINNVLTSFFGLNRKEDRYGLEEAILSLREMLKYVQSQRPWVTIEEEFAFLERYCSLQKIRFGDRFRYRFDLDPECRFVQIPRLILQPLVENALVHGIQPAEDPRNLLVKALGVRRKGEVSAEIFVEDDGLGFDSAEIMEKEQIGLSNVRQRLEIMNPNHQFRIISVPGEGTKIYIHL